MKDQIKGKYLRGSLPPVSQKYQDNYDSIQWKSKDSGCGIAKCMECGHWTPYTGSGPQYCRKHKVKED